MIRFDERRLKENDGDDFRDFVAELLRALPGYGRPVPRDSGSVDGCIDLYCDREGLVVECKFVGADVKDESGRVEQEWKSVRDKLDENLTSSDGHAAPGRAPYAPWADAERPIKRYIFATSARLANEAKQREIATRIASFFRDDLGKRPGYERLRPITVEVIDWTSITAHLVDHPPLVFKWLEQWPEGFAELDDRSPVGFRAFFHSDKLPYLARDSWQPPTGLRHPWTETSLIEEIIQPDARDPIIVLIGHGGVGKTRLGLECARRMRELGWWTIRCNGLLAKTAGLRQLLENSPTSKRVLLFVDYLETWPTFEGFANDILELNQSSGHQVRIVATCRASYRERLATFMKIRSIGGEARIEVAYSEAVTRHILSKVGKTDIDALAEKCRNNFALAAFLAFLSHEKPHDFAVELSELRQEPNFESWIVRRLQNAGLKEINAAAAILAACDFTVTAFDKLAEAYGGSANDLRRILIADKWIERREPAESREGGPVWAAFHDILADVVLARAIDVAPDRDDAIDRLLELAVANGVFRQTFTALGRLKHTEVLAAVDWRARLLELERRKSGTLADYARLLLANALLTPEVRLALIASNGALEKAIASDSSCDLGLALTAAALSSSHADDSAQGEFDRTIVPLLDIAIARSRQTNIILRLSFRVRPERYREAVRSWIITHPDSFQTHFLLKGWLDQAVASLRAGALVSEAHVDAVGPAVSDWLATFPVSPHATFVLASWLNAAAAIKGERAVDMVNRVASHATAWWEYDDHATSDEAEFVYHGWLEAAASIKGDRATVMISKIVDHLTAWLDYEDHASSSEAGFIYPSWLKATATMKGERANDMLGMVAGHLDRWLADDDHATNDNARFLYQSWLDAAVSIKGDRAADMVCKIEIHLERWLKVDDRAIQNGARFIYSSWLEAAATIKNDKGADMVSTIAPYVTAWLAHDDLAISDEAKFLYPSWLNAAAAIKGDKAVDMISKVESHLGQWLSHGDHAIQHDAQFIYASWLGAAVAIKGDKAIAMVSKVAEHIAAWLRQDEFAISGQARYIYVGWLEAAPGAQFDQFHNDIVSWILVHQNEDYCSFVLRSWLDRGLEFDPVAEPCFKIVRRSCRDLDAVFILKHVVRQKRLPEDVIFAALCWCSLFADHEDALNRLGPLLRIDRADLIGPARLTRVTAKVLFHQDVEIFLADPFKLAAARATLGSLFDIGRTFPPAEKLARIYFARWLRDGRIFCPAINGQGHPIFDQKFLLAESLLTLLEHGEFVPRTNDEDNFVITQFCQWVSEWESPNFYDIAGLVGEMSDRFGMPNLWQRMLPKRPIGFGNAVDELPNPFLHWD